MTEGARTKAKARLREIKREIEKLEAERCRLEARLGWCQKSENCMQVDGHDGACRDCTVS